MENNDIIYAVESENGTENFISLENAITHIKNEINHCIISGALVSGYDIYEVKTKLHTEISRVKICETYFTHDKLRFHQKKKKNIEYPYLITHNGYLLHAVNTQSINFFHHNAEDTIFSKILVNQFQLKSLCSPVFLKVIDKKFYFVTDFANTDINYYYEIPINNISIEFEKIRK